VAKTETTISYDMDAVSPIKNGGSSKLMEKLNCKLAYALYRLHSGDASARRHASAIRSNSIAFVFVIGHWNLLLLWKCDGSKLLVRGYCPHSYRSLSERLPPFTAR